MERYADTATEALKQNLPSTLRPLTKVNYILGTFPYAIEAYNGKVILSSKSVHFYRAIFTYCLICITSLATIYRFLSVFRAPPNLDSNGNPEPMVARIVELACAFYANCITLVILGLTFFNRKKLQEFFNGMESYAASLRSYIDPLAVAKRIKKLYFLYGFLALISATVTSARFYVNPYMGPISVLFEFFGVEKNISQNILAWLSGIFIFYIALVKFACLGFVDIISCGIAKCLSRCMENIIEHLESQVESWGRQFKGMKSQIDKDDFLNILAATNSARSSASSNSTKAKFQNELENYIDQIRELNPGLVATDSITVLPNEKSRMSKLSSGSQLLKTTPGKALSHAARSFTSVAAMQNVMNGVFGHTLAINIGCIVGMSVILKYLVIKNVVMELRAAPNNLSIVQSLATAEPYFLPRVQENLFQNLTLENENETYMETLANLSPNDDNDTMSISNGNESANNFNGIWNPYGLDHMEWLLFLGLDLSMFIRLGVVVISLGKVHKTSLRFNSVMSKSFLAANRLIDELSETLQTTESMSQVETDEMSRALITQTQMSSIVAFMNLYNANPVAFTAGGLFVFSSGLLLMIISIIISYLVFLLQA